MRGALLAVALTSALAHAQIEDHTSEHRTFPGVRELIIDNVTGFIHVTAGSGNAMDADIAKTLSASTQDRLALARKEVRLDVTQEGGLVRMKVDWPFRDRGFAGYQAAFDFTVRVPKDTALDLRTVNHSDITVEGTTGSFDIRNVNGGIEMRDVEGSGEVRTVNGGVKVTFARNPQGPVSFHSVNGTLEAAFRAGLNAASG